MKRTTKNERKQFERTSRSRRLTECRFWSMVDACTCYLLSFVCRSKDAGLGKCLIGARHSVNTTPSLPPSSLPSFLPSLRCTLVTWASRFDACSLFRFSFFPVCLFRPRGMSMMTYATSQADADRLFTQHDGNKRGMNSRAPRGRTKRR